MASADSDYATTDQVKDALDISGSGDDAEIALLITEVSRAIDNHCRRRFYVPDADETRYYDVPRGLDLYLDEDLYSLTTLTNGDGSTIAATEYKLYPSNRTWKRVIRLLGERGNSWLSASGGILHQAISVTGKWGYSESPPAPIRRATILMCGFLLGFYEEDGSRVKSKSIRGLVDVEFIDASEIDIPPFVERILRGYVVPREYGAWAAQVGRRHW